MVPQVNKRGQSFKGVTAYLMHDKEADTSKRVMFAETRNLPFGDVESASRFMAWTDLNADALKYQHEAYTAQLEGRDPQYNAGRPTEAGNVYHMSLAWHTSQEPDREQMTQAADDAVQRLGLDDHQYYIVAHDDTDHAHIHVVVNLVHPVTGKVGDIYKDHDVLDRWANEYQHENGEIVCQNRADKFEAWEQSKPAFSDKERKDEAGERIEQAYRASDGGAAFVAALEAQGFELARGRRNGFVVVDQDGEIYAPARHIEGVTGRDVNTLLKEIDKADLPDADELQEQRQNYDSDAVEAAQQGAMLEAADEAARRKVAAEDVNPAEPFKAAAHDPHEQGSIVRTWARGAQGVITGFEDGRYEVTFSNKRTGKEIVSSFKPDEIKLVRTPEEDRAYQYERDRQRAQWTDWNLVRERETRERIEERKDYWQLDHLEAERDQAQRDLDERSGWINRYVLRWRYQDASDELDAKQKNLNHAEGRWQTDIHAIQAKRTDELRRSLEEQGFVAGGKRSVEPATNQPREEEPQKLQRDMSPEELEGFAQEVLADIEERLARQREERDRAAKVLTRKGQGLGGDHGADVGGASEIKDRERDGAGGVVQGVDGEIGEDQDLRTKQEDAEKLQRDMSEEEQEALRAQLMEDMQDKREGQYAEQGHADDVDDQPHEAMASDGYETVADAEDQLQRDMSEAELEAYRDRLREIIIETQDMQGEVSAERPRERDLG